jgi:hypothetical protein
MNATVVFKIGDIEIKTPAGVPTLSTIQGEGRDNMTINNALSKIKSDLGLDLRKMYSDIKEKATIFYDTE